MNRKASAVEVLFVILGFLFFCGGCGAIFFLAPVITLGIFLASVLCFLVFAMCKEKKAPQEKAMEEAASEEMNALKAELAREMVEKDALSQEVLSLRQQLEESASESAKKLAQMEKQALVADQKPKTVLFEEKYIEEKEALDLKEIAQDTIQRMKAFAESANIRMAFACTQDTVPFTGSEKLMSILMRNIVDNSVKYMRRPGNMHITLSDIGDDIFMIFKDDGMGLRTDELPFIFDLNFQGSNRVSGNGLGLTQARDIVTAYGGVIYAKSAPGEGMGIYVQIPKKPFSVASQEVEETPLVMDDGEVLAE